MVHANSSRSGGNGSDPRFDGGRIAAGAGAIALHVALLMLVLVPMKLPPLTPQAVRLPDIQWTLPEPAKPVEPIPLPVEKAVVVPEPTKVIAPPTLIDPPPVLVDQQPGDIAVAPVRPVTASHAEATITPPSVLTGAALRYAAAPPPPYPVKALRAGHEGTVLLEVLVDIDGQPLTVSIARSSGHRELDRAALRHVLAHWRFQPALQDGRPVQAIGLVPIGFALGR